MHMQVWMKEAERIPKQTARWAKDTAGEFSTLHHKVEQCRKIVSCDSKIMFLLVTLH